MYKRQGIVLVEKAYLEPRYNKKITFKAKSLDQQKAGINIHYVTFGPGGNRVSSGIKSLDIVPIPSEFAIRQNYPNPFNPLTQIRYEIPEVAHIEVIIFDLMGREVVNLLAKEVQAGYHAVQWKGQNEYGRLVGAGVYFAQLRSAGYSKTIKMLLLK